MKKSVITMLFISASMLFVSRTNAQVSINVNIGNVPAWAPEGYDDAQYYYIPDIDVYYDVPAHQFLYLSQNRWMRSASLPAIYRGYDLYRIHKVALNQKNAYLNHNRDIKQYARFKGKFDQQPIRDSHNEKYSTNKSNWRDNKFNNESANNRNRENDNRNDHPSGRHSR